MSPWTYQLSESSGRYFERGRVVRLAAPSALSRIVMDVHTHHWSPASGWNVPLAADTTSAQLVFSLGPVHAPPASWFTALAAHAPKAQHVYASGGGQFHAGALTDEVTIVSFLTFSSTRVIPIVLDGVTREASAVLGATLGQRLSDVPGLRHVLLFAEDIAFNADAFLGALNPGLPPGVRVSGGLASNGTALTESVVGLDASPSGIGWWPLDSPATTWSWVQDRREAGTTSGRRGW